MSELRALGWTSQNSPNLKNLIWDYKVVCDQLDIDRE